MWADEIEQPFDSIESAHDFMNVLAGAILEATKEIRLDQHYARLDGDDRRARAVELALFKLKMLNCHVHKSRRLLNDLRLLRRIVCDEQATVERELAAQ